MDFWDHIICLDNKFKVIFVAEIIFMSKILIIGAGRSSSSLIDYFLSNAKTHSWHITIADTNKQAVESKISKYQDVAAAVAFDVHDVALRESMIKEADFVVSMLPALMHGEVARDCVRLGKHLATASYVSQDMKDLDKEAKSKNLLLLNECGLDPGIDHASAMKIIHEIQEKGGKVTGFKSFCGGLVAPESNDNPWGYKFSWNPRNVVLAGQGTAQFIENGKLKFIPYNRIYTQIETIEVEGYGNFDAYANRDSIGYKEPYGLTDASTMLRGTLRMPGYCKAWNVFVKLGLTDDTYKIKNADALTYTDLLESFLPKGNSSVKEKLVAFMGPDINAEVMAKLEYLELFANRRIKLKEGSPAELLQNLLEEKWLLKEGDKDMIVMQHQFEYELKGAHKKLISSLVVIGDDEVHTAMAKTVGLPLAITIKNFLKGKFKLYGVQIPTVKEIYEPMLTELEELGIRFTETEVA
ncbi:MAG: saccharopine dehydrogenase [Bacteroidota bacterium]|jgi:saccharopine dehydrogenase-like NADP-dependent oxidoreductase|nr:saccharopine dehydrogenase [Bacteroidota bacterium]